MKFNQMNRMANWVWLMSAAFIMGLIACSDGNESKHATGQTTGRNLLDLF